MRQKEIWYADLNPARGSEESGYRAIVIVSGNLLNTYLEGSHCLSVNFQNKVSKKNWHYYGCRT